MRVLVVEDDRALALRIAEVLRQEHFAVDIAANGEDGQHQGATEAYDAAILDLGLPLVDGTTVLRAWRAQGRSLPVLILTARDGWSEGSEQPLSTAPAAAASSASAASGRRTAGIRRPRRGTRSP